MHRCASAPKGSFNTRRSTKSMIPLTTMLFLKRTHSPSWSRRRSVATKGYVDVLNCQGPLYRYFDRILRMKPTDAEADVLLTCSVRNDIISTVNKRRECYVWPYLPPSTARSPTIPTLALGLQSNIRRQPITLVCTLPTSLLSGMQAGLPWRSFPVLRLLRLASQISSKPSRCSRRVCLPANCGTFGIG